MRVRILFVLLLSTISATPRRATSQSIADQYRDVADRIIGAATSNHRAYARLTELVDRFGEEALRQCPGFADKNGRTNFWTAAGDRDGYVVPYRDEHGRITGIQLKLLGGRYEPARGTHKAEVYHFAGGPARGSDSTSPKAGSRPRLRTGWAAG